MPKSKFHNQSDADLADEYGNLHAQIKSLEEKRDALKEELALRCCHSEAPAVGQRWTVTASTSTASRLDTKALRGLLGDGLKPYEKETTSTRVTVKPTMIFGQVAAE